MDSVKSHVDLFNLHVKENRQGLKAREERTDNLMINLFKGYMDTSDKEFSSCMKPKKDENDEVKETSEVQLINLALNKHVSKKLDGEWSAPFEEVK